MSDGASLIFFSMFPRIRLFGYDWFFDGGIWKDTFFLTKFSVLFEKSELAFNKEIWPYEIYTGSSTTFLTTIDTSSFADSYTVSEYAYAV